MEKEHKTNYDLTLLEEYAKWQQIIIKTITTKTRKD